MTCNGEGVRSDHRIKMMKDEELFGGMPCNGSTTMTETCNEGDCPGTHGVNCIINVIHLKI